MFSVTPEQIATYALKYVAGAAWYYSLRGSSLSSSPRQLSHCDICGLGGFGVRSLGYACVRRVVRLFPVFFWGSPS